MPKWAEKAVTLMDYRVVGSRLKKAFAQNIFVVALAATAFGSFGVGCGTEAPKPSSEPAAEAKPVAPAIPEDIQDDAKHLLGSDAQVLLFGDLAKNGKRQLLAANVVPKTPQNNVPGTVVTRAIVAQDDDGKWTELLRVDEHLKNQKGYLGLTPLDSITGWRLQYEQNPEKGLQLYFTPLKVNGDTHVLTIGVRWNPATNRYQSLDASYEHFLKESSTLQNVRSSLR
ncbi:MAG TPA: hypothetical protein VN037_06920 [Verrucomicrobiae bacterium]|nr:hypothetical protein [Verrucomicrobiae bacterium]